MAKDAIVMATINSRMFKVMSGATQVGRSTKTLEAAEHAVQKKFGKAISGSGSTAIHIVDEAGNILRVFYVN